MWDGRGHPIPHSGKVQKLASLSASYCSVRFSHHLRQALLRQGEAAPELLEKAESSHFDSRVFNVPSIQDMYENIAWRQEDGKRNSTNNLGFLYFSQKQMHEKSPMEIKDMLRKGPGVLWDDLHPAYRFGALLKKQSYEKVGQDVRSGNEVTVVRSRVARACVNWHPHYERLEAIICSPRVPPEFESMFSPLEELEPASGTLKKAAVLWDLDGTLVDTEPLYAAASRHLWPRLASMDGRTLRGMSEQRNMEELCRFLGRPIEDAPEMIKMRNQVILKELRENGGPEPMPGVWRLVNHLHHKGIPMGIVTSSQREMVAAKLGPLAPFFDEKHIVCDGDTPLGKPSPQPVMELLRRLDVGDPKQALYFEDSISGVKSGITAGVEVIYASPCSENSGSIKMAQPLSYISLNELSEFLPHLHGLPSYESGIEAGHKRQKFRKNP